MEKKKMEELLETRIKVIALWPNTAFVLGEIICQPSDTQEKWSKEYPHLFKELSWWEDRKPEEMPEYVKVTNSKPLIIKKILKWYLTPEGWWADCDKYQTWQDCRFLQPSTQAEYETFKSK